MNIIVYQNVRFEILFKSVVILMYFIDIRLP